MTRILAIIALSALCHGAGAASLSVASACDANAVAISVMQQNKQSVEMDDRAITALQDDITITTKICRHQFDRPQSWADLSQVERDAFAKLKAKAGIK